MGNGVQKIGRLEGKRVSCLNKVNSEWRVVNGSYRAPLAHLYGPLTTHDSLLTKKAFTLAEVLITLGIIGVVAALTIPTLVAKYQKQVTVSQLKKVYSTITQAYERSKLDNGEYKDWNLSATSNPKEYVMKYWAPYFKTLKGCDTYQDCGYDTNRPWISLTNEISHEDVTGTAVRYALILSDGIVLSFRIPPDTVTSNNGTAKITVDINGAKEPNKIGRDYFWFEITFNGQLRPYFEDIGQCSKNTENQHGGVCLSKIVEDGWQIKDDYPW